MIMRLRKRLVRAVQGVLSWKPLAAQMRAAFRSAGRGVVPGLLGADALTPPLQRDLDFTVDLDFKGQLCETSVSNYYKNALAHVGGCREQRSQPETRPPSAARPPGTLFAGRHDPSWSASRLVNSAGLPRALPLDQGPPAPRLCSGGPFSEALFSPT